MCTACTVLCWAQELSRAVDVYQWHLVWQWLQDARRCTSWHGKRTVWAGKIGKRIVWTGKIGMVAANTIPAGAFHPARWNPITASVSSGTRILVMEFSLKLPNSLRNVADLLPSSFSEYSTQLLWITRTVLMGTHWWAALWRARRAHGSSQLTSLCSLQCVFLSPSASCWDPQKGCFSCGIFLTFQGSWRKQEFVSACGDAH